VCNNDYKTLQKNRPATVFTHRIPSVSAVSEALCWHDSPLFFLEKSKKRKKSLENSILNCIFAKEKIAYRLWIKNLDIR
jgi:hypothetical protein